MIRTRIVNPSVCLLKHIVRCYLCLSNILIREGGSTLLTSAAQVVKNMKDITSNLSLHDDNDDTNETIILLCNGAKTDNRCGITTNITKAAQNLMATTTTPA